MIELRWILDKKKAGGLEPVFEDYTLQYRVLQGRVDAAGAWSVLPIEWSDWMDVPYVAK